MVGTLDFYLLVELMVSSGRNPDRDTFIAVLKSARNALSDENYVLLQQDIKALMVNVGCGVSTESAA